MEDIFEQIGRGEGGGGYFLLLKKSKMVVKTHFLLLWELLPNMQGMVIFKVLLLFVELHHH